MTNEEQTEGERPFKTDREMNAIEHFLSDYAVSPQWQRGLANRHEADDGQLVEPNRGSR